MITTNPSPPMSLQDVSRFRSEMRRHMRGEFTTQEKERMIRAKETYEAIIKTNGGKNPILGY